MILIVGGAYQGKAEYAREHFPDDFRVIEDYQERVRTQLEKGIDPMEEAKKLPLSDEKLIILCDEVGSGLVPMDAFERAYREQTGRVGGYLASRAERVIRVVCGIGKEIKVCKDFLSQ
ncbi:MAG: bifunctional adenosylcobinamide kinase/adenosylcobinamide-phosphate guanylyltransferase [Roseburia sp.]|nr:bifunctional adenosylcobinamide kinase/adenosylcobinamide-phosphate guanylyltransferase [Roseburia sp.]MCM1097844.1 bifunctional adenosylcobinamide kinase/adenosylcobinamide-phosphate guanylyltransferase [Ruminococcus flavefaciens]